LGRVATPVGTTAQTEARESPHVSQWVSFDPRPPPYVFKGLHGDKSQGHVQSSRSQIVVDGDGNFLLRAKVAFGGGPLIRQYSDGNRIVVMRR